MNIDGDFVSSQIEDFIRAKESELQRDGVVLGMSGGIDSALVGTLATKVVTHSLSSFPTAMAGRRLLRDPRPLKHLNPHKTRVSADWSALCIGGEHHFRFSFCEED